MTLTGATFPLGSARPPHHVRYEGEWRRRPGPGDPMSRRPLGASLCAERLVQPPKVVAEAQQMWVLGGVTKFVDLGHKLRKTSP